MTPSELVGAIVTALLDYAVEHGLTLTVDPISIEAPGSIENVSVTLQACETDGADYRLRLRTVAGELSPVGELSIWDHEHDEMTPTRVVSVSELLPTLARVQS